MRKTALVALAALAIALAASLVSPSAASACSCVPGSDSTLLAQADAVFAGTATARVERQPDPAVNFSGAPVIWTFAVDTVVKGAVAPEQRVVSALQSASCGMTFTLGRRYLVFSNAATGAFLTVDPHAGLGTGVCSGNRPLAAEAPIPDLAQAAPRRPFPIYWLGETFAGLVLDSVSTPGGRASFDYRGCAAQDCGVVLRVRTVRTCRVANAYLVPLTERGTIRGVPSGRRGRALVLFTGSEQVRILGEAGLARRAARALIAANRPQPADGARAPLPSPAAWAVGEGLACPTPPASRAASRGGCPLGSAP